MARIWLNHWFSTAYNIINLIKQGEEDFVVIGSNTNENWIYKPVCDEAYVEPKVEGEEYIEFCLEFCKEHRIDVFMPRRNMVLISEHKKDFEKIGVKVMVEDYSIMSVLNQKNESYELFREKQIGYVPDYYIVKNAAEFLDAYNKLVDAGRQVCFKFVNDEGGKSYRLIDNSNKDFNSLHYPQSSSRMSLENVMKALNEREEFEPIMVMPYLSGNEVSVDCLKTSSGVIMIPRVKGMTRVESVEYDKCILDICKDFYDKVGLEYPCNIQFRYLDGIPYFLEVNTRMSGGVQMSCLASGINIPNIAVNKLLGIDKEWENNFKATKVSYVEFPLIVD